MKRSTLLIKNAHLIDPYTQTETHTDVLIENGTIKQIAPQINAGQTIETCIDAKGRFLMPGAVDLNTHLREPGFELKATIASELKAAVKAGIAHLACLPSCSPTIDSPAIAKSIIDKANELKLAKVYPIAALTKNLQGEQLSEMKALFDAHCPAMTNYYHRFQNLEVVTRCYEYAASFNIPVFIYPQLPELAKAGGVHDGVWSARLGLPAISRNAESIAIATQLLLIEQTGVRAHFSQLSSAKAVEQIAAAKKASLNITADVTAHQLFLDDSYLQNYDSHYNLCPPLRTQEDAKALIQGLKDGVIDAICSSHQPHEAAAKNLPFEAAESGISSLETLLPLAGKLEQAGFSKMDIIRLLSLNPAKILGIKQKGISEGERADMCLIDTQPWTLTRNDWLSSGKNSPFFGENFHWKNTLSVFNGRLVYQNN